MKHRAIVLSLRLLAPIKQVKNTYHKGNLRKKRSISL